MSNKNIKMIKIRLFIILLVLAVCGFMAVKGNVIVLPLIIFLFVYLGNSSKLLDR